MKFIKTPLKGAYIIEIEPFVDERGMFARFFCKEKFKEINNKKEFVQINHSWTRKKGSIRGMHYQLPPSAEVKMIKCIKGSVLDVIIDIRESSPTFLKWSGAILSKENKKMMLVPEGFAHGFQTLEDNCELLYFHTQYYDAKNERGIRYNDLLLKIKWPLEVTKISEKDKNHPLLKKDFKGVRI